MAALAEDGNPGPLAGALATNDALVSSGVLNTPVGADGPGPITPGGAYEFSFTAKPGDWLSFATMFVQSNDLFFASHASGIRLFVGKRPISGNISFFVQLWDAGTEVNQAPGLGADQAPRQAGANTGADENGAVQLVNDGFNYPRVRSVLFVTIRAN